MLFLYNLFLIFYGGIISTISPVHPKAKKWIKGRTDIFKHLQKKIEGELSPVAWFHCASLGEFEQARPVLEKFKENFSNYKIFLTFFSPSGYEIRKDYSGADYVFYLPLDSPYNAKKFIEIINPKVAFFTKYEFWYYYLNTLNSKRIPIISFSAIFRPDQIFFRFYGGLHLRMLKYFDRIFVQNISSLEILNKHGIKNAELASDTRFDRVMEIVQSVQPSDTIEKFKGSKKLMVIGSCWPEDMERLYDIINKFDFQFIIAPHEIHRSEIEKINKNIRKPAIKYSESKRADLSKFEVLIIDNIGMLSSLYLYGEFAYVGGAFGKGLHNILEPATFGMPILFGPKYEKYQEAKDLIALGSAFSVSETDEIEVILERLQKDEKKRKELSDISRNYIVSNVGATDKIIRYCKSILSK